MGDGAGHALVAENAKMLPHPQAIPLAEIAVIPKEKLTAYVLDPSHQSGGGNKAQVFESVLGITQENWQVLSDQLLGGLPAVAAVRKLADQYGERFQADIEVTGPNGRASAQGGLSELLGPRLS